MRIATLVGFAAHFGYAMHPMTTVAAPEANHGMFTDAATGYSGEGMTAFFPHREIFNTKQTGHMSFTDALNISSPIVQRLQDPERPFYSGLMSSEVALFETDGQAFALQCVVGGLVVYNITDRSSITVVAEHVLPRSSGMDVKVSKEMKKAVVVVDDAWYGGDPYWDELAIGPCRIFDLSQIADGVVPEGEWCPAENARTKTSCHNAAFDDRGYVYLGTSGQPKNWTTYVKPVYDGVAKDNDRYTYTGVDVYDAKQSPPAYVGRIVTDDLLINCHDMQVSKVTVGSMKDKYVMFCSHVRQQNTWFGLTPDWDWRDPVNQTFAANMNRDKPVGLAVVDVTSFATPSNGVITQPLLQMVKPYEHMCCGGHQTVCGEVGGRYMCYFNDELANFYGNGNKGNHPDYYPTYTELGFWIIDLTDHLVPITRMQYTGLPTRYMSHNMDLNRDGTRMAWAVYGGGTLIYDVSGNPMYPTLAGQFQSDIRPEHHGQFLGTWGTYFLSDDSLVSNDRTWGLMTFRMSTDDEHKAQCVVKKRIYKQGQCCNA